MSDPESPDATLMPSLGKLVRGLSALFWGLPIALVVGIQSAKTDWLAPFGIFPMVIANSILFFGLNQLGHFRTQERIWVLAVDKTKLLGLINLGLSPFVCWWHRLPHIPLFAWSVGLLAITSIIFLIYLNFALQRLAAMLPDETMRYETQLFTNLNCTILVCTLLLLTLILVIFQLDPTLKLGFSLRFLLERMNLWLLVLLVLLPVATTMALIWKIKETILRSIFGSGASLF